MMMSVKMDVSVKVAAAAVAAVGLDSCYDDEREDGCEREGGCCCSSSSWS